MRARLARFLDRWPYRRTARFGGALMIAEGAGMILGARLAHGSPLLLRWGGNVILLGIALVILAMETAE